MTKSRVATLLTAAVGLVCGGAQGEIVRIDPRATYLRTASDPLSLPSTPISLATIGIAPGDLVELRPMGGFAYTGNPNLLDSSITAVFSTTEALLSAEHLNRVPGAVDAGLPTATLPTFFQRLTTDIPEDFAVAATTIRVPTGAQFLFVTVLDSFFSDNGDPAGSFGLIINRVPAPGAAALLCLGGALCVRRRRGT